MWRLLKARKDAPLRNAECSWWLACFLPQARRAEMVLVKGDEHARCTRIGQSRNERQPIIPKYEFQQPSLQGCHTSLSPQPRLLFQKVDMPLAVYESYEQGLLRARCRAQRQNARMTQKNCRLHKGNRGVQAMEKVDAFVNGFGDQG